MKTIKEVINFFLRISKQNKNYLAVEYYLPFIVSVRDFVCRDYVLLLLF